MPPANTSVVNTLASHVTSPAPQNPMRGTTPPPSIPSARRGGGGGLGAGSSPATASATHHKPPMASPNSTTTTRTTAASPSCMYQPRTTQRLGGAASFARPTIAAKAKRVEKSEVPNQLKKKTGKSPFSVPFAQSYFAASSRRLRKKEEEEDAEAEEAALEEQRLREMAEEDWDWDERDRQSEHLHRFPQGASSPSPSHQRRHVGSGGGERERRRSAVVNNGDDHQRRRPSTTALEQDAEIDESETQRGYGRHVDAEEEKRLQRSSRRRGRSLSSSSSTSSSSSSASSTQTSAVRREKKADLIMKRDTTMIFNASPAHSTASAPPTANGPLLLSDEQRALMRGVCASRHNAYISNGNGIVRLSATPRAASSPSPSPSSSPSPNHEDVVPTPVERISLSRGGGGAQYGYGTKAEDRSVPTAFSNLYFKKKPLPMAAGGQASSSPAATHDLPKKRDASPLHSPTPNRPHHAYSSPLLSAVTATATSSPSSSLSSSPPSSSSSPFEVRWAELLAEEKALRHAMLFGDGGGEGGGGMTVNGGVGRGPGQGHSQPQRSSSVVSSSSSVVGRGRQRGAQPSYAATTIASSRGVGTTRATRSASTPPSSSSVVGRVGGGGSGSGTYFYSAAAPHPLPRAGTPTPSSSLSSIRGERLATGNGLVTTRAGAPLTTKKGASSSNRPPAPSSSATSYAPTPSALPSRYHRLTMKMAGTTSTDKTHDHHHHNHHNHHHHRRHQHAFSAVDLLRRMLSYCDSLCQHGLYAEAECVASRVETLARNGRGGVVVGGGGGGVGGSGWRRGTDEDWFVLLSAEAVKAYASENVMTAVAAQVASSSTSLSSSLSSSTTRQLSPSSTDIKSSLTVATALPPLQSPEGGASAVAAMVVEVVKGYAEAIFDIQRQAIYANALQKLSLTHYAAAASSSIASRVPLSSTPPQHSGHASAVMSSGSSLRRQRLLDGYRIIRQCVQTTEALGRSHSEVVSAILRRVSREQQQEQQTGSGDTNSRRSGDTGEAGDAISAQPQQHAFPIVLAPNGTHLLLNAMALAGKLMVRTPPLLPPSTSSGADDDDLSRSSAASSSSSSPFALFVPLTLRVSSVLAFELLKKLVLLKSDAVVKKVMVAANTTPSRRARYETERRTVASLMLSSRLYLAEALMAMVRESTRVIRNDIGGGGGSVADAKRREGGAERSDASLRLFHAVAGKHFSNIAEAVVLGGAADARERDTRRAEKENQGEERRTADDHQYLHHHLTVVRWRYVSAQLTLLLASSQRLGVEELGEGNKVHTEKTLPLISRWSAWLAEGEGASTDSTADGRRAPPSSHAASSFLTLTSVEKVLTNERSERWQAQVAAARRYLVLMRLQPSAMVGLSPPPSPSSSPSPSSTATRAEKERTGAVAAALGVAGLPSSPMIASPHVFVNTVRGNDRNYGASSLSSSSPTTESPPPPTIALLSSRYPHSFGLALLLVASSSSLISSSPPSVAAEVQNEKDEEDALPILNAPLMRRGHTTVTTAAAAEESKKTTANRVASPRPHAVASSAGAVIAKSGGPLAVVEKHTNTTHRKDAAAMTAPTRRQYSLYVDGADECEEEDPFYVAEKEKEKGGGGGIFGSSALTRDALPLPPQRRRSASTTNNVMPPTAAGEEESEVKGNALHVQHQHQHHAFHNYLNSMGGDSKAVSSRGNSRSQSPSAIPPAGTSVISDYEKQLTNEIMARRHSAIRSTERDRLLRISESGAGAKGPARVEGGSSSAKNPSVPSFQSSSPAQHEHQKQRTIAASSSPLVVPPSALLRRQQQHDAHHEKHHQRLLPPSSTAAHVNNKGGALPSSLVGHHHHNHQHHDHHNHHRHPPLPSSLSPFPSAPSAPFFETKSANATHPTQMTTAPPSPVTDKLQIPTNNNNSSTAKPIRAVAAAAVGIVVCSLAADAPQTGASAIDTAFTLMSGGGAVVAEEKETPIAIAKTAAAVGGAWVAARQDEGAEGRKGEEGCRSEVPAVELRGAKPSLPSQSKTSSASTATKPLDGAVHKSLAAVAPPRRTATEKKEVVASSPSVAASGGGGGGTSSTSVLSTLGAEGKAIPQLKAHDGLYVRFGTTNSSAPSPPPASRDHHHHQLPQRKVIASRSDPVEEVGGEWY